jgi:hypothetical protein
VLQGRERKFAVHTLTMPARTGQEVSLIEAAGASGEAGAVLATPVVWLLAAVVVRAGVRSSRARDRRA